MEQEINDDRESNLERVNIQLERLLDKADKDLAFLRHMAFHGATYEFQGTNKESEGEIKEGDKEAKEAKRA